MTVTTLAYIPSPAQGVWFIGPVPLRAYALCIIAGIVAALVIGDRRWEARGGERGVIYDIALWAVPFGLVGGRIYHVMTDWPTYFGAGGAGLGAAFRIWDGGLGIWGAVALGGVGAWIACRRRGIPLPAFGDAIAPGIILAQAVGRLGNYFNQELYGRATTLPWGLEIYERRDAAGFRDSLNGVSTGELVAVVHPTFLYELLWNLLIFALLLWVDRRYRLGHGRVFALYVAGYCLGRFWIELMRSDAATLIAGIRVNSFTSTFIFIAAVVYVMVAPKGREDPAALRGNAPLVDGDSAVDEVATEVIEVGAAAGIVAAAKAAGAAEGEDAAGGGETTAQEVTVADAADEADDVEEPVETEAVAEESAGDAEPVESVDAEPADDSAEAEAEAEAEAVGELDAADAPVAEESPEVVEADEATEGSAVVESVDVESVDAEAADDSAEAEAEAEAEPVAADAPVAEESPEVVEGDEAADVEEPVETEPETESAEGSAVVASVDAETADDSAEAEAVDDPGAADAPVAEESPETEAADAAAAEPAVEESAQIDAVEPVAGDNSPETELVEGDSGDAEAADAVEEPEPEPEPADAGEKAGSDAKRVGERFRAPRWFRRNG